MSANQFVTYAQNGEDILLWRALKHVHCGFYIDVGAQDPVIDSVTKAFYDHGWRGVNIEPVRHWYERLTEQRPRDINLCIAASDHDGELKLYESDDSGLSTSEERFARAAAERGWNLHEATVPCTTLSAICSQHVPGPVHFLKIDCEGAEAATLRGMPLDKVRPWIVLIEATEPNSAVASHSGWESLLTGSGYEYVYGDGVNRYYVAKEHSGLRTAFTLPPSALDDYIHASELRARELQRKVTGLQSEFDGQGAELSRLRNQYRDITEGQAVLQVKLADLHRDLHLIDKERVALQAELARLQGDYRDVTEERAALQAELAKLQGDFRDVTEERAILRADLASARRDRQALERDLARQVDAGIAQATEISRLQAEYRDVTLRLSSLQREHAAVADAHAALGLQLVAMQKSRSWRLTAPLRALRRACGKAKRGAIRCTVTMSRPSAHALRPALRRLAHNKTARGLVVRTLGRNAPVVRHGRLFLFGAPSLDAATPTAGADSAAEPDDSMLSRRERIAMSELRHALKLSTKTGADN